MKLRLFSAVLLMCTTLLAFGQTRPKDKIIINKRSVPTTQTNTNTSSNTLPNSNTNSNSLPNTNTQNSKIQRVQHDFTKRLEYIELRYSVDKLREDNNNTYYRITGHIYSDIENEALFGVNKRIVLFQIPNWDSGFFGDDLQSIDGFATTQQLNPELGSGPLYQFGNSPVRDFSFEFKVKRGQQPDIRTQIYPDWRILSEYEPYLLLEYASLNGTWSSVEFPDTKFDLAFSAQGDQIGMKDFYGQDILWTLAKEGTYVRQIGNVPQANTQSNTQTNSSGGYLGGSNNNNNNNSNTNTPDTNTSNYPEGGYLGGGSNNNANTNSNTNSSGGYLGDSNNNTTNQQGNVVTDKGYVSVIQIVDRRTLSYTNSEGISITLTKDQ